MASGPPDADLTSMPLLGFAALTCFVFVSKKNRFTGPSRSERKNTRSPIQMGEESFELVRGIFVIVESDRFATQTGDAVPPR